MRFRSGLLRKDQDQRRYHDYERERCSVTAHSQSAFRDGFIEKIAKRGAKRAS